MAGIRVDQAADHRAGQEEHHGRGDPGGAVGG
jgi:hypothetical protein